MIRRAAALRLGIQILPYVMPAVVIALEWKLLSPTPALADHFQFWAAGHLALTGSSPYDRESWVVMAAYGPIPDGVAMNTVGQNLKLTRYLWLYPPQTAFLFVPFGALSLAVAIPLLHLFIFAAAVLGVVLAARVARLAGSRLAFALTLAAISQPFVIGVRDGHPLGLVLAGAALAFSGAVRRQAVPLMAGIALISIKPHIALVFGIGVLVFLVARRELRLLAAGTAAAAVVTIPAELAYPFPLAALTSAADERFALDVSSLGALSRDIGGGTGLVVILALIALAASAFAVRAAPTSLRYETAFAALLALSLVAAPYAHDYDQLLTLPASFVGLTLARGSRYELPLILLFALLIALVPWILFFWWPLLGQGDRIYQAGAIGALPVIALLALAVASAARGAEISPAGEARGARPAGPYATNR